MKRIALLAAFVCLLSAAACDKKSPAPDAAAPSGQSAAPAAAPALMNPASAIETAPEVFKAKFSTTKGDFVVEAHRSWCPRGADRFYNLVKLGYFDDVAFFRAIDGFMVQFGIHGSPAVSAKWREANIQDDPPGGQSNKRGFITYATAGPNTRTTQLFINYADNSRLDSMGFVPFGQVVSGMEVVESFYKGYGEGAPMGRGPDQNRVQMEGNSYLKGSFPNLDYVKTARLE
jgi:peptidyl-prolyl cis-trans isomerase A (cyclophilin A)